MKALNHQEVLHKYLIFIGYFSMLLLITICCTFFFFKTKKSYVESIRVKKEEVELFQLKSEKLSGRIDSLNLFLSMLNTNLVVNEGALENSILKLKNEALQEIEELEKAGDNQYFLYKRLLLDLDQLLDAKKSLQQVKEYEENYKRKLLECNKANIKLRNR